MTETATKTRTRRTPAEKAQAELDAANTRCARAMAKRNRLREELKAAEVEFETANKYVRFAAQHPDLPDNDG